MEYEKDILQTCRRNLSRLKIYRVEVRQADASVYEDYDAYNYFYLFNPFHNEIMKGFVENLKKSKESREREIHVLYLNPVDRKIFEDNGFAVEKKLRHGILVLRL